MYAAVGERLILVMYADAVGNKIFGHGVKNMIDILRRLTRKAQVAAG